jgi:hypothetical protein
LPAYEAAPATLLFLFASAAAIAFRQPLPLLADADTGAAVAYIWRLRYYSDIISYYCFR